MKNLLLGKSMETYSMGTYHKEWEEVLCRECNTTLQGINENIKWSQSYNLIIFSHSFLLLYERFWFNRVSSRLPGIIQAKLGKILMYLDPRMLKLRSICKKATVIFFSRNDYKDLEKKTDLAKFLETNIFVTHSSAAIPQLNHFKSSLKYIWIPFSVSRKFLKLDEDNPSEARPVDIGLRGSISRSDVYPEREQRRIFAENIQSMNLENLKVSVELCTDTYDGCYLEPEDYKAWLSSLKLLAFNESALGTLGPKYFEAIARGCSVIAPVGKYEDLLVPDVHYVSVNSDFSNLSFKVHQFMTDSIYREKIERNSRQLLESEHIDAQYARILKLLP